MPTISSIEAFALACEEPNYPGQIRHYTLARIGTGNGELGWGEARCHNTRGDMSLATKVVIEKGLGPIIKGKDPLDISKLMSDVGEYTYWSSGGASAFASSAIEIALQDLRGKILGVPTHKLLGGQMRNTVKACATIIFDLDSPENNVTQARDCIKDGFRAFKFDWGLTSASSFGQHPKTDLEAVRMIRESVGPEIDLFLDVGLDAHWSVDDAIKMSRQLEPFDIGWLEEPLERDDYEGYAELRKQTTIPLAGAEWEYDQAGVERYLDAEALDIIQPEVGRFGGIQACKNIADLAAKRHVKYSPHTWSTAVNMAASLQVLAATTNGLVCEKMAHHSPYYDELPLKPINQREGFISIPTSPGIGIEVNEEFVNSHIFNPK